MVRRAKDDTLFSVAEGTVVFRGRKVHVVPSDAAVARPAWLSA